MSSGPLRKTLVGSTDGYTSNGNTLDSSSTINAATSYSVPIPLDSVDRYRVHFTCPSTGSPVGSVKLQASVDAAPDMSNVPSGANEPNWVDLSFATSSGGIQTSFAINGAASYSLDENACNYLWVRMVLTLTSGTIAPTVKLVGKRTI